MSRKPFFCEAVFRYRLTGGILFRTPCQYTLLTILEYTIIWYTTIYYRRIYIYIYYNCSRFLPPRTSRFLLLRALRWRCQWRSSAGGTSMIILMLVIIIQPVIVLYILIVILILIVIVFDIQEWENDNYHVMWWLWAVFQSGDCFFYMGSFKYNQSIRTTNDDNNITWYIQLSERGFAKNYVLGLNKSTTTKHINNHIITF